MAIVDDFGGFARIARDDSLGGHRNRLVFGTNVDNGENNEQRYVNTGNATKGPLVSDASDRSKNASAYIENSFSLVPNLALVVGTQFLHATRTQIDHFLSNGDQSGENSFDLWTPKGGLLWDVNPSVQFFGNVSRSAEVPTFDVNTFTSAANSNLQAQTATTFELGTRGKYPNLNWDVALYRANIKHELQCLTGATTPGVCTVTNVNQTVHQGVEAGLGVALAKSMFAANDRLWLNTTYTYNGFRFDNDAVYQNNRLPGVAPHLIRGELLYNGSRDFYVGPNVEWTPQPFYADTANTLTANPYALLNLRAGLDLVRGWSIWAEGRDLTDKAYISTAAIIDRADPAGAIFDPGYGRAIYTGVRFTP